MRPLILIAFLAAVATVLEAEPPRELTVRYELGGELSTRLLVGIGPPASGVRVALTGAGPASGSASPDRTVPLSVTVDAPVASAGALSLEGLVAELRAPVARTAASSHWERAPGLAADLALEPVSRVGAVARVPAGITLAGWRERDRLVAAFLASRAGEQIRVDSAVVSSAPAVQSATADGWSSYDGPAEPASLVAAGVLAEIHTLSGSLAAAISLPTWGERAVWLRGAFSVDGPGESTVRLYGAAVTPGFRTLGGRSPSPQVLAALLVRREAGTLVSSLAIATRGAWVENRPVGAVVGRTGCDVNASIRWTLVADEPRLAFFSELGTHLDETVSPPLPSLDASWGLEATGGPLVIEIRQRLDHTDIWAHRERLSVRIDSPILVASGGRSIEFGLRGAAETDWDPFGLSLEFVLNGRYVVTDPE